MSSSKYLPKKFIEAAVTCFRLMHESLALTQLKSDVY